METLLIAAVIGAGMTRETLASVFELSFSGVDELIDMADRNDCLQRKGDKFLFAAFLDKISDQKISSEAFQKPIFRYLKEKNIKQLKDEIPAILERIANIGISGNDIVLLLNAMGDAAKSEHCLDHALEFYDQGAIYCKAYQLGKKLFVRCVLNISKLDFMRGISPLRTLQLQNEALTLVHESNLTAEDALLMLYAGIGKHFAGEEEEGFLLRKKGDDYLKQFDNTAIHNEAIPLIGWHLYLLGNFQGTIAYYETMILAIENRKDVEVIAFAYPPIIFSYFFLGEFNRALILNEIIYKHARERQDHLAATLMYSISGRVHLYMKDNENAEAILYKAYAESLQEDYGWGKYYTLFALCMLHLNAGRAEACREALVLANEAAKKHNFGRINASPFVLDALKMIETQGLPAIEGMRYEDELSRCLHSRNIHLAGVSCRHIALLKKSKNENMREIIKLLERSIELLQASGNSIELGKSYVELTRVMSEIGDKVGAERNAELGWQTLGAQASDYFPNELRNLLRKEELQLNIAVQLETIWLELRHIINPDRLVTRILTSLNRVIKVESSAIVGFFDNNKPRVLISQNIDMGEHKSLQYQRLMGIVSYVTENKKHFIYFDEKAVREKPVINLDAKPGFIFCVPFFNNESVGAVLYLESYYRGSGLTEKEIDSIQNFVRIISPHLFATLCYDAKQRQVESSIQSEQDVSYDMSHDDFCVSMDETVSLIMNRIKKVAGTDIPVLLTGETGSGKEVFAKELYRQSKRKNVFIKVNCSAIPESLIESELFGYERGSFTGATHMKKGYFELADGGTIFLDEIGELSLLAQVKLLRVLQEQEIMRVGGTEAIKIKFRLIAATNKDLKQEVEKGTFRRDLYYRLNVMQFEVPPLRERKSDIPRLARFFVEKYCRLMEKENCIILPEGFLLLLNYDWPGNIRELENVVQKAVLLAEGHEIKAENFELSSGTRRSGTQKLQTLEEVERNHILKVISHCNGKIAGPEGAAALLGLKRTTLISRMEKYGIRTAK